MPFFLSLARQFESLGDFFFFYESLNDQVLELWLSSIKMINIDVNWVTTCFFFSQWFQLELVRKNVQYLHESLDFCLIKQEWNSHWFCMHFDWFKIKESILTLLLCCSLDKKRSRFLLKWSKKRKILTFHRKILTLEKENYFYHGEEEVWFLLVEIFRCIDRENRSLPTIKYSIRKEKRDSLNIDDLDDDHLSIG